MTGEALMKLSPTERAWIDKALLAIAAVEAGPSEAGIAKAPVLSDWMPAISPVGHVILLGQVVGHPILGRRSISTSQLIAINPEAGWARTVSRWYRLAEPIAAVEAALAKVLGLKNPTAAAIMFAIPGFITLDDMATLNEILTANIARIRQFDVADRNSSERRD